MKKYLATFLVLILMTSFSSCGNTQENSSKPSDSVSVSATEEVTTEKATIAETVTEKPTEKEIILDSEWECDYLTIAKCSEWDEQINKENDGISVFWHDCKISLFLDESISQKLSEEDLKEWYSDLQYDDYKILDTFEKNGQAYLMMGHENSSSRDLKFSTGTVSGTFDYSVEDEEIVMDMINSIEFKQNFTTTKPIEKATISDYETYENDFYTMKVSSEWDSWSENSWKWFNISPNLKLKLWGASTDLRYNNNKDFAEYWVNDANNDERITYPFEVSVFGENYFAHSIEDNCFSYVCQNGEIINFFDFHFKDALSENEEKIISDILTSVKLKYM